MLLCVVTTRQLMWYAVEIRPDPLAITGSGADAGSCVVASASKTRSGRSKTAITSFIPPPRSNKASSASMAPRHVAHHHAHQGRSRYLVDASRRPEHPSSLAHLAAPRRPAVRS
jgi:hypothetical protein